MQCIDITITDDDTLEGDETFTVTLTVTNPPSGVMLDNDMVEITITDNDCKCILACHNLIILAEHAQSQLSNHERMVDTF